MKAQCFSHEQMNKYLRSDILVHIHVHILNEQIFKESIPIYEEALKKSGFHEKLEYVREEVDKHGKEEKKRRKRKIIWFNPPYSNNVKSNVGKQFLKLVRRHFPKGHKLSKIFNKNTLKVSYSCMRNMSSVFTSHNKKILAENEKQYECNCRNKDECPLDSKYLTPRVIYEADVITFKHFSIVLYWVI